MGLWGWRGDDSCGSAVIVLVRERGSVVAHFRTPATITRFGGLEIVVLPSTAKLSVATVIAKLIERMHSSRKMVITMVLFMQPAYVRIVFVTWRSGSSKRGVRRRKIRPKVARWRWRWPRREGIASRIRRIDLKRVVCEKWAFTTLPLPSTLRAEFGTTPTGDMTTAVLDLHHGFAAVATLPRFPFCHLLDGEQRGVIITRAFRLVMPPGVARGANLGPATATPALPARAFEAHILTLQQRTAPPRRTSRGGSASVLLELLIPLLLEAGIEQLVNGFGGDIVISAAARWHVVLRIGEGELEDLAQTGMAHAVAAFELRCPAHGGGTIPASHAHGSTLGWFLRVRSAGRRRCGEIGAKEGRPLRIGA
jgi:hypothetical protein